MLALARTARLRPYAAAVDDEDVPDVSDLLASDGPLPEHESALVLERLGVRFAPRARAANPEQAAASARELGPPVVVKLDGPAHKSQAGGVIVGVASPEDAAAAARKLAAPVLVAKQIEGVNEVFCGMTRDAQYGPVLAVGRGGAGLEAHGQVALTVTPLDHALAGDLVAQAGIEDEAGDVARVVVALGRLARAYPQIDSIDVNPLLLTPAGAIAVDALVVVARRS
jgi:acyl-CoA synthetase (NDP forming)